MYIKPASGIKIKWILRDEKLDSLLKVQHTSVVECLITLVDIKHAKASFKFILSVVDGQDLDFQISITIMASLPNQWNTGVCNN